MSPHTSFRPSRALRKLVALGDPLGRQKAMYPQSWVRMAYGRLTIRRQNIMICVTLSITSLLRSEIWVPLRYRKKTKGKSGS